VSDDSNDLQQGTQAVQRALRLLSCFRVDRPQVTLAELSAESELTPATSQRILKALQSWGYVEFDEHAQFFRLGPAVMKLSQIYLQRNLQSELVRIAHPVLERLRDATGETAALHCPINTERVCLLEAPSRELVRMSSGVGNLFPLYTGAAGKIILAWSTAVTLDRVLAVMPAEMDADGRKERMLRELPRLRKKGYAISMGETAPSATSIAVPVFSANRTIAGSILVAGPKERWTRDAMLDHVPLLLNASAEVSGDLGFAATRQPVLQ
jgi:DNA-binding IclR family transcriptional regulator